MARDSDGEPIATRGRRYSIAAPTATTAWEFRGIGFTRRDCVRIYRPYRRIYLEMASGGGPD